MATATTRKRVVVAAGGLLVVLALVLGTVLAVGGDDDDGPGGTTPDTSTSTSTTAASSTTTPPDPGDVDLAAYPDLRSGVRFDDPQALVQAFATQVLGFDTDLVVGELQQGDSRSGEVPVMPRPGGPVTTVPVRQVSDDTWVVVAATSELIRLDVPEALAALDSPQPLEGSATAFEGHVDVALYADGQAAPIATTFVTGSGGGELGEFSGELTYETPDDATHGVLVLTASGGEDGTTQYATAIRVRL